MKKTTLIVTALTIALIVSLGFNAYQVTQTNTQAATKLEMITKLTQAQVKINTELQSLGNSAIFASQQLKTNTLDSQYARQILASIAQNKSYIIDVSTIDMQGTFITVEPATYQKLQGTTTHMSFDIFAPSNDPIYPIMSPVTPLEEGFNASVIMTPIFNSNGIMIGAVSIAFDQSALIGTAATEACKDTPYAIWASDTDGTMIYEVNPSVVGTNLFTDPTISTWTQLQTFTHKMVSETAGYGTYEYFNYEDTDKTVTKQAYWETVSIYNTEWRLIITNVMA